MLGYESSTQNCERCSQDVTLPLKMKRGKAVSLITLYPTDVSPPCTETIDDTYRGYETPHARAVSSYVLLLFCYRTRYQMADLLARCQGRDGQGSECQGAFTCVGQGQIRRPRHDPNPHQALSQGGGGSPYYRGAVHTSVYFTFVSLQIAFEKLPSHPPLLSLG